MPLFRALLPMVTSAALILATSLTAAPATAADPADAPPMTRICVTEWRSYYGTDEASCRKRFDTYKELGVDTLRLESGWSNNPAMVAALRDYPFRIKLILYVLGIPHDYAEAFPGERMIDEHGAADWHLGPWNREFEATTLAAGRAQLEQLKTLGFAARVDEVVADLGPAGEGIYPANWTLGRENGEEAYWCYSVQAQADFRAQMAERYDTIAAANAAWGLGPANAFAEWAAVSIPPPGTAWARGAFWQDMLVWYRDAKRNMMLDRIRQTQELTRELVGPQAKCIVYLPGYAYTQTDWDEAVKTASGPASIRLMMDNDWLMTQALEMGCVLQYTGVENATEVRNIVRKLRASGSDAYRRMWGENAGYEAIGRRPRWLSQVITSFDLRGVDLTWSNWLFEADGVTPSQTCTDFAGAVKAIREYAATGRPDTGDGNGSSTVREIQPGVWYLQAVADTRVMGSFPDTIKGFDPEIAVVGGGQVQRLLLRFPLEHLPRNQRVTQAHLVMKRFVDYGDDARAVSVGVYRVTEPWTELGATWEERLPGKPWAGRGGTAVDAAGAPFDGVASGRPWATTVVPPFSERGTAMEWDVTQLVRDLRAGNDCGIMLAVPDAEATNKSMASREHPDDIMRPALIIKTEPK